MEWKEIGKVISKTAPMLGTIIGGPAGAATGGIISLIASAFGIKETNSPLQPDQILKAIKLDPEAMVKLQTIEMSHKVELEKLIIEGERIRLTDIASARNREIEVVKATGKKDIQLYALAWVVLIGFFVLCFVLMRWQLPTGQNEVVFMLFGALSTGFGTVLQYFFGSSKSSKDKTEMIMQRK